MIGFASFPVLDKTTVLYNDSCDNIILKNGEEISAKIIEITPDLIKYKKCRNLDGPLISIYKNEVLMLRYNDGSKDIFSSLEKKEGGRVSNESSEVPWGGIMSLFFATIASVSLGLAGPFFIGLFFSALAIAFGGISFNERLWGFALAGLILGILTILPNIFFLFS